MKTHKTSNSQNNPKKEKQSWRNQTSWRQTTLQSYSEQSSWVLVKEWTSRSVEQKRQPRNKFPKYSQPGLPCAPVAESACYGFREDHAMGRQLNPRATPTEPTRSNCWSALTLEPVPLSKPLQREACATQWKLVPARCNERKPACGKGLSTAKNSLINF